MVVNADILYQLVPAYECLLDLRGITISKAHIQPIKTDMFFLYGFIRNFWQRSNQHQFNELMSIFHRDDTEILKLSGFLSLKVFNVKNL